MKPQTTKERTTDATPIGARRANGHREHDRRIKAECVKVYAQRAAGGRPLFKERRS